MDSQIGILRVTDPAELRTLLAQLRSDFPDAGADMDDLRSAFPAGASFYAVRQEGETRGIYSLQEVTSEVLSIRDFCLPPQHSVSALEYLIGQTGDAGYQELQIVLPETDTKQIRLFRKHYFKPAPSADPETSRILLRRKMQ